MISFTKFIGELVAGIAKARVTADMQSVQISEQYHADPYIKQLPIPRYTIDEAEVDVPVVVTGLNADVEEYHKKAVEMVRVLENKMPQFVQRSYKYNYDRLQIAASLQVKMNEKLLADYQESIKRVVKKVKQSFTEYIDAYNYNLLKLLDFEEFLKGQTQTAILEERDLLSKIPFPFVDEKDVANASKYIAGLLFFEFVQLISLSDGVQLDIITSNMNEYNDNSCVMKIKLKIREQDVIVQTEMKSEKNMRRFLTLV